MIPDADNKFDDWGGQQMVTTNNLLTYEASGCGRTALNEVILPPGETLPLAGTPKNG